MKTTIKGLGAILAAATLFTTTSPAFAGEVAGQSKDTNTTVKIIDNVNPDSKKLELVTVPSDYNFETTLQSGSDYAITSGTSAGNFTVFSNQQDAAWSVKSVVDATLTSGTKTVDVTGMTVNGKDVKTGAVLMDSTTNKVGTDGKASLKVDNLSINFSPATGTTVDVGDVYTGQVHNTLYDTVDAN